MDPMMAAIVYAAGLMLRLGLPFAITALLVRLLRRLDARWEAEARQVQSAQPALAPQAGVRCWEVRGCSPRRRANCPAYQHPEVPCWQHFRKRDGQLQSACLDCNVFTHAPAPAAA